MDTINLQARIRGINFIDRENTTGGNNKSDKKTRKKLSTSQRVTFFTAMPKALKKELSRFPIGHEDPRPTMGRYNYEGVAKTVHIL